MPSKCDKQNKDGWVNQAKTTSAIGLRDGNTCRVDGDFLPSICVGKFGVKMGGKISNCRQL